MATENISTGNFYRILKDKATSTWDRISFWTHASDVELSSGTSLETDLSNKTEQIEGIQSDFAQIEPTSVSSHVYTKGMMLVYNNQLYRATSAIASGETLVVGTNIESASVGTLANMLTASNGNQFYLDVKDGTYGFYPSASKVPAEFVPFGGSGESKTYYDKFSPNRLGSVTVDFSTYGITKLLVAELEIWWTGVVSIGVFDFVTNTYVLHNNNYTAITKQSDTSVTFRNTSSDTTSGSRAFVYGSGKSGEGIFVFSH